MTDKKYIEIKENKYSALRCDMIYKKIKISIDLIRRRVTGVDYYILSKNCFLGYFSEALYSGKITVNVDAIKKIESQDEIAKFMAEFKEAIKQSKSFIREKSYLKICYPKIVIE